MCMRAWRHLTACLPAAYLLACLQEFAINKWACECVVTRAMQDAYMIEVLPALDRHPAVERYAWYTARDNPDEPGGIHTPVGGALDTQGSRTGLASVLA